MQRFTFTISAGRTGTRYLAHLLARNMPGAEVHHERLGYDQFGYNTPDLSHFTLFNSQGNVPNVQRFWDQKLRRIAGGPNTCYAETAHVLVKAGLVENITPLTETGEVHLIVLTRDIEKTIASYLVRGDFANKGLMWLFYLDPDYPRNIVDGSSLKALGQIGTALWYYCEMACRAAYYEKLTADWPNVYVHRASLSDITQPNGAAELLTNLGQEADPAGVTVPPPQNTNPANMRLTDEAAKQLRQAIRENPFDPDSFAEQFLAAGARIA